MRRASRFLPRVVAAVLTGLGAVSCGAGIQAVYEGDVRFEHCMALDAQPDIKPTLRRACWDEWRKFYTFGQTRDRIEYASLRDHQLSGASDFDEGEWQRGKVGDPSAVPEPTSALAPPPMLIAMTDAGVADAPPVERDAAEESAPPAAECAAECEQAWGYCRHECKTAPCDKGCSSTYKRCMKRCF